MRVRLAEMLSISKLQKSFLLIIFSLWWTVSNPTDTYGSIYSRPKFYLILCQDIKFAKSRLRRKSSFYYRYRRVEWGFVDRVRVSPEPLPLGLAQTRGENIYSAWRSVVAGVKDTNVSLWIATPLGDCVKKCLLILSLTVGQYWRNKNDHVPEMRLHSGTGAHAWRQENSTTVNVQLIARTPPLSLLGFCVLVETIGFSFAWKSNAIIVNLWGKRHSATLTENHTCTFDLKKCLLNNDLPYFIP